MLSPLRCLTHSPSMKLRLNSQRKPRRRSESETRSSESSSLLSSSELEAWDLSTDMSSQENLSKQKIRENVEKLGRLADRCEQVNLNLVKVVDESHKILDNSFLASQAHLTNHVTSLNYGACLDIGTAIDAYSEFVEAVQELVEAEEEICANMLHRLEKMNAKAQILFQKAMWPPVATDWKQNLCEDSDNDDLLV